MKIIKRSGAEVEFDQHKIGTVTQSESTMHTLAKRPLTEEDFEIAPWPPLLQHLQDLQRDYAETPHYGKWRELVGTLPQSFLQRRIITTNYAQLQNIVDQRWDHKLIEWHKFVDALYLGLQYRDLIFSVAPKKGA